jgi:hypothetical protein
MQSTSTEVDFYGNVNASSWWGTIRKNYYYQAESTSAKVAAGCSLRLKYARPFAGGLAYGCSLASGSSAKIVSDMITTYRTFPYDPNAIYYVLLGSNIKERVVDGFNMCADYCC